MKTLLSLFLLLLLPGSGRVAVAKPPTPMPTPTTPPPEVRRAPPVVPPGYTLSEADVRATVEHMQRLAREQQEQLDAKDAVNARLSGTVAEQQKDLAAARTDLRAIRTAAKDLARQVAAQDDALAAEKWARLKDRLFGWPVAVGIGVALGVALALFTRLGVKAAGLGARIGLKTATGI